jgi:two-component system cell cycle response regulator CtrA
MDEPEMKIIDVFICKLRKKLALAGAENLIGTVCRRLSESASIRRFSGLTAHRERPTQLRRFIDVKVSCMPIVARLTC